MTDRVEILVDRLSPEDATAIVRASKATYEPLNPVAVFTDQYGEERVIHRPRGAGLRVHRGRSTVPLKMNAAIAGLLGARVRARRLELGLTLQQVALRAGMANGGNPKNVMHAIESAGNPGRRTEGVRLGTLFALAFALECQPCDLLPPMQEVMEAASVGPNDFVGLTA